MDKRTAQIFVTDLLHHETKDWDLLFPVQEDFLSVFSLWGEKNKEVNQGFKGAFYLAETVSQELVFALNYMIVICSLLLHVCHVWHSVKPKISEKCYSFSIVFKYRAGGSVIPSCWWLYCTYKDRLHIVWASRRASFSPSYKERDCYCHTANVKDQ